MKKIVILSSVAIVSISLIECKSMAKAAARYWTKQQIKEFKSKCNEGVKNNKLIGNASDFCDCATDNLSEKFHRYEDVKAMGILEIIKEAKDCAKK
ncbi:MAG TPA: hypothetical protein VD905_07405 [Flavobacteriales bacterium]|nr:hypothetical protein [Flavobacteriales bacterium]